MTRWTASLPLEERVDPMLGVAVAITAISTSAILVRWSGAPSVVKAFYRVLFMSALDTSRRTNVISTLTLSEETGRVTIFEGGSFETTKRTELGGEWNPETYS